MIGYKDILQATTKLLDSKFPTIDIHVENTEGIFDAKCFYVTVEPVINTTYNMKTNRKSVIVSVKYFGGSKIKNYEIADSLQSIFNRKLEVKDRFLEISKTEPNFINDEVGQFLDFLIFHQTP